MTALLQQRNKVIVAKAQKGDVEALQYCIDKNIDRKEAEKILLDLVAKGKASLKEAAKILKMPVKEVKEQVFGRSVANTQETQIVTLRQAEMIAGTDVIRLHPMEERVIEEEIEQHVVHMMESAFHPEMQAEEMKDDLVEEQRAPGGVADDYQRAVALGMARAPFAVEARKQEAIKQLLQDFKGGKVALKFAKDEKGLFILKAVEFADNKEIVDQKIGKWVLAPMTLAA